jgi:hypothetical protein
MLRHETVEELPSIGEISARLWRLQGEEVRTRIQVPWLVGLQLDGPRERAARGNVTGLVLVDCNSPDR